MAQTAITGPSDTAGLICGFTLNAGTFYPVQWEARACVGPAHPPTWLHFNLVDARASHWIATIADIPEEARDLLLDRDPHIRCKSLDDGLALVIADLHHDFTGDPEDFGVLRVYVDRHCMISGRYHPLRAIDHLRRDVLAGFEASSLPLLFARLIFSINSCFHELVQSLSDRIDEAEDDILAGKLHEYGAELGGIRRLLARLRRHMGAGRQALQQGVAGMHHWCDEEETDALRQAIERFEGTMQDLELVQERTRLLQEEIGSRLNEATNRNLYILSLVTVVLLPINLITGIFGMNTGGLPGRESDAGFWWVLFLMIVAVVVAVRILNSRRIL